MSNRKHAEFRLAHINKRMGTEFRMDVMQTGLRVVTANESRDVSPRLSPKEMVMWLDAFGVALDELERMAPLDRVRLIAPMAPEWAQQMAESAVTVTE